MNIWDVLEIEATSSARAIKRAYARQLAKHHPEDDPEGFQLVQAAYERAYRPRGQGRIRGRVVCAPCKRRSRGRRARGCNHGARGDGPRSDGPRGDGPRSGGACGIGAQSGAVRR